MTPTLMGRWQTRLFLMWTVGLVISLLVGALARDFRTPVVVLLYVTVFGFVWDILYQYIQSFRWDRDWPPAYQLAAGIIEAIWIGILIFALPWRLPGVSPNLPFWLFLVDYWLVWIGVFIGTQGPLRILFPRWRFRGGRIV